MRRGRFRPQAPVGRSPISYSALHTRTPDLTRQRVTQVYVLITSSSVLSASLADRRTAVDRSKYRVMVVAVSYAALIVAIAVAMF